MSSVGVHHNYLAINKINKTEENKNKRDRGNKNENMTKCRQGSQQLDHNFSIY